MLIRLVNCIACGTALAFVVLAVFALLFGGVHALTIAAMGIALASMCLTAALVRTLLRVWAWGAALAAAVVLLIPIVDYSKSVALATFMRLRQNWIAGGSGTDFTSVTALIVASVLIVVALLLHLLTRP